MAESIAGLISDLAEGSEVRVFTTIDGVNYTLAIVTVERVELTRPFRKVIAQTRKNGLSAGDIGNSLMGKMPDRVVRSAVAYAAAIRNPAKVNQYWGNA